MASASRWQRTGHQTEPLISDTRITLVDWRCSLCGERRGLDSTTPPDTLKKILKEMNCKCR